MPRRRRTWVQGQGQRGLCHQMSVVSKCLCVTRRQVGSYLHRLNRRKSMSLCSTTQTVTTRPPAARGVFSTVTVGQIPALRPLPVKSSETTPQTLNDPRQAIFVGTPDSTGKKVTEATRGGLSSLRKRVRWRGTPDRQSVLTPSGGVRRTWACVSVQRK